MIVGLNSFVLSVYSVFSVVDLNSYHTTPLRMDEKHTPQEHSPKTLPKNPASKAGNRAFGCKSCVIA